MKSPLLKSLLVFLALVFVGCPQEGENLFAIEVTGYRTIGRIEITARTPIFDITPVTVVGHAGTVSSDGEIIAKNETTGAETTVDIHPLGSFVAEVDASTGDTITLTYKNGDKTESQEIVVSELEEPLPLAEDGFYVSWPDEKGRVQVEVPLAEGLGEYEAIVVNPSNGNVVMMTPAVGNVLVAQINAADDDTVLVYFISDRASVAYEGRPSEQDESPLAIEVTGYRQVDLIGITATQQVSQEGEVPVRITGAAGSVAGYGQMAAINLRTQELTQAEITPEGAFSIPVNAKLGDEVKLIYENNYTEEALTLNVEEMPPFYEPLDGELGVEANYIEEYDLAQVKIRYHPEANFEVPYSLVFLSNPQTGEVRRMEHLVELEQGLIIGSIHAVPGQELLAYRLIQGPGDMPPEDPNGDPDGAPLSLASLAMAIEVTGF
jgi:hypothetical protein